MKIAFLVVKDFLQRSGGIEKYTREVGRRLVKRGHAITVYSTGDEKSSPAEWEGIRIKYVPKVHPHWMEKLCGSVLAATRARCTEEPPDVFHLHSVAAGAMGRILRASHVPCVLQMHGIEWRRSRWGFAGKLLLKQLEQAAFRNATAVTAVSEDQCEYYRAQYGMPVSFIPTGTEVRQFHPPLHLNSLHVEAGKYFFTAVRLVREKGLHYLIPAYLRLSTDWQLLIAGDAGGDRDYVNYLHELAQGSEQIRFLGHVASPLLDEYYSNAGAYVQASELEGMSIALLEAMSYGQGCIASDIPENRAVLAETGIFFRNKNVDALANALQNAVQNPASLKQLGEMARQRALDQFTWDQVTLSLEALYASMQR